MGWLKIVSHDGFFLRWYREWRERRNEKLEKEAAGHAENILKELRESFSGINNDIADKEKKDLKIGKKVLKLPKKEFLEECYNRQVFENIRKYHSKNTLTPEEYEDYNKECDFRRQYLEYEKKQEEERHRRRLAAIKEAQKKAKKIKKSSAAGKKLRARLIKKADDEKRRFSEFLSRHKLDSDEVDFVIQQAAKKHERSTQMIQRQLEGEKQKAEREKAFAEIEANIKAREAKIKAQEDAAKEEKEKRIEKERAGVLGSQTRTLRTPATTKGPSLLARFFSCFRRAQRAKAPEKPAITFWL